MSIYDYLQATFKELYETEHVDIYLIEIKPGIEGWLSQMSEEVRDEFFDRVRTVEDADGFKHIRLTNETTGTEVHFLTNPELQPGEIIFHEKPRTWKREIPRQ